MSIVGHSVFPTSVIYVSDCVVTVVLSQFTNEPTACRGTWCFFSIPNGLSHLQQLTKNRMWSHWIYKHWVLVVMYSEYVFKKYPYVYKLIYIDFQQSFTMCPGCPGTVSAAKLLYLESWWLLRLAQIEKHWFSRRWQNGTIKIAGPASSLFSNLDM